jgi:hypothetical protein
MHPLSSLDRYQVNWGGVSHGYTKQISSVSMGGILFFFMQLSKMKTCLPISPTSLAELGRSNVEKFYTNIYFIHHSRESSPHQPWVWQSCWLVEYHNRTQCILWVNMACEVNFSTVCFLKWYMLLWSLEATDLLTSPPTHCYLDCFDAICCHQTFLLGAIQN